METDPGAHLWTPRHPKSILGGPHTSRDVPASILADPRPPPTHPRPPSSPNPHIHLPESYENGPVKVGVFSFHTAPIPPLDTPDPLRSGAMSDQC